MVGLVDFLKSDGVTYEFEKPYTLDGEECRYATDEEVTEHLKKAKKDPVKQIILFIAPILSLIISACCKSIFGSCPFVFLFLSAWCVITLFVVILEVGFNIIDFTSNMFKRVIYGFSEVKNIVFHKNNRKFLYAIIVVCTIAMTYQLFFRYKYRTYKGNYNQVQVIKVDTLTGKSTVSYPEFVENKK